MTAHEKLVFSLYDSFQKGDYRSMGNCYHEDAVFKDPVFNLTGKKEIQAMWHYLIEAGGAIKISFTIIRGDNEKVWVHWEAKYYFSKTHRAIHNIIEATMEVRDGKIARHTDQFSFYRWSRMALGFTGYLLGWTPFLRKKVRKTAARGLQRFIESHPEYQ